MKQSQFFLLGGFIYVAPHLQPFSGVGIALFYLALAIAAMLRERQ